MELSVHAQGQTPMSARWLGLTINGLCGIRNLGTYAPQGNRIFGHRCARSSRWSIRARRVLEIEEDRTDRVPIRLHRAPVGGFGVEVHVERRRRTAEEVGSRVGTEVGALRVLIRASSPTRSVASDRRSRRRLAGESSADGCAD